MNWMVSITTVPSRYSNLCANTKASLIRTGFENIRLYVDGYGPDSGNLHHVPRIGAYGNWVIALWDMWIRNPKADRYVVFQDDVLVSSNLKEYLENCSYPVQGYWNLYTDPTNELPSSPKGWYTPVRSGLGALGLVLNRSALRIVLKHPELSDHVLRPDIGKKNIDGALFKIMKHSRWSEYVHNPSLIQHAGRVSTVATNKRYRPDSNTFQGEDFDCLTCLEPTK